MDIKFNINADVGEGMGDDAGLMPLIQACNIACGGHSGNQLEIKKTTELAQKHQVLIGAHPSYPDPINFGRRTMKINKKELYQSIEQQLSLLLEQLPLEKLNHIKPHGALYHDCINKEEVARIFLEVIESVGTEVIIFTSSKGYLAKLADKKGIEYWNEAFIDRAYQDNGQLLARSEPNSVLNDSKLIYHRIQNLTQNKGVYSINGNWIPLDAKILCVHGDHPNAASLLKSALSYLEINET